MKSPVLERLKATLVRQLDDSQQEAVFSPSPRLLVLASAGAGKTRVLTHRLAYFHALYPRYDILAVTFTNRAAREMKARVEQIFEVAGLSGTPGRLWISTFHAFCARILRRYGHEIGIPRDYLIADEYRQQKIFKDVIVQMGNDPRDFQPVFRSIRRLRVDTPEPPHDLDPLVIKIWNRYIRHLRECRSFDFNDLQHETIRLLEKCPHIRESLQNRFVCVLVDEFQDTNRPQYRLFRLLREPDHAFFVVGDQDQSIYGFRGSRPEHFHRLLRDYPDTKQVALRYNYRTRENIVRAAMHLIARNPDRLPLEVKARSRGGGIKFIEADNEIEEARAIAEFIRRLQQHNPDEVIAILVRARSLLRDLEQGLRLSGIRYQVIGLRSWWDSPPVRVVLDYLAFLRAPDVDDFLVSICNIPSRKLGPVAIQELKRRAAQGGYPSLWAFLQEAATRGDFHREGWSTFHRDVKALMSQMEEKEPVQVVQSIVNMLSERWRIPPARREGYEERWNQLISSVTDIHDWDELMAQLTLSAPEDIEMIGGAITSQVRVMTVHAAKGLEFDTVIIPAVEEGIFPHFLTKTPQEVDEERRVFFVAMTRARREVVLTLAKRRRHRWTRPSPFLSDIPADVLAYEEGAVFSMPGTRVRTSHRPWRSSGREREDRSDRDRRRSLASIRPGDRVQHPRFGKGIVQEVAGTGERRRVTIWFFRGETRTFRLNQAPLEMLD